MAFRQSKGEVIIELFAYAHRRPNFRLFSLPKSQTSTSVTRLDDLLKVLATNFLTKVAPMTFGQLKIITFKLNSLYLLISGQLFEKNWHFLFQHLVALITDRYFVNFLNTLYPSLFSSLSLSQIFQFHSVLTCSTKFWHL